MFGAETGEEVLKGRPEGLGGLEEGEPEVGRQLESIEASRWEAMFWPIKGELEEVDDGIGGGIQGLGEVGVHKSDVGVAVSILDLVRDGREGINMGYCHEGEENHLFHFLCD